MHAQHRMMLLRVLLHAVVVENLMEDIVNAI